MGVFEHFPWTNFHDLNLSMVSYYLPLILEIRELFGLVQTPQQEC